LTADGDLLESLYEEKWDFLRRATKAENGKFWLIFGGIDNKF
jgi:hypothetical protein